MSMKRVVQRVLPSGETHPVQPFHVCLKGLEQAILCRDNEDYDAMVKTICVCARRKNVIIIIYGVVSNHSHAGILARCQSDADAFGVEIKKIYSMWFQKKYKVKNILHRIEIKAICLDSDPYVRNVLAYIPKNAMDNGASVHQYPWTGFRAMFSDKKDCANGRRVSSLNYRERAAIMHTKDSLKDVPWLLDGENRLIPESFCDYEYLEQAFNHDPGFYLRLVGGVNSDEMRYLLEEKPYRMQPDSEFFKTVNEICNRWYKNGIASLSEGQKIRIVPYIYRTTKTTAKQLSRILGLSPERIETIIRRRSGEGMTGLG